MKKLPILLLFASVAFAQYTGMNTWTVAPFPQTIPSGVAESGATGMVIQGATQKMAIKFYATSANALVGADVNLKGTGTLTGISVKFDIETDSSDAPSGTILGAVSGTATPAAGGFTGLLTFGSNTGALTLNTPYWLVVSDGGGTAPTSSNYYQLQYSSTTQVIGNRERDYNGTNWTTVTPTFGDAVYILKDTAGNYYGFPATATAVASTTHLYTTTREGVKWRMGAASTIIGVRARVTFAGSPSPLALCLMTGGSGGAVIDYVELPAANLVDNNTVTFMFPASHTLSAGTYYYLIAHQDAGGGGNVCQDAGGGTSSNYYALTDNIWSATYYPAGSAVNFVGVSGTSTDPGSLSTITNSPVIVPIFADPYTSLSAGSSSVTVAY